MRSYKVVIFDMDGVIADSMPYHYRAWRDVFRSQGISVTRNEIYCREGQKGLQSVLDIFKKHNQRITVPGAKLLLVKKEKIFKKIIRRRFVAGSRAFILDLHKRGVRLALVTGTSRDEITNVLPDDLLKLFSVVITGSDVVRGKPHPDPYLKAMSCLAIRPKDALVIENAPFGIHAAKAAGLKCLAIATSLPHEYLQRADLVVDSFQELKKVFYGDSSD